MTDCVGLAWSMSFDGSDGSCDRFSDCAGCGSSGTSRVSGGRRLGRASGRTGGGMSGFGRFGGRWTGGSRMSGLRCGSGFWLSSSS